VGKAGLMNIGIRLLRGSGSLCCRQPVFQAAEGMELCVSLLTWGLDVVRGAKTQTLPLPERHLFKILLK